MRKEYNLKKMELKPNPYTKLQKKKTKVTKVSKKKLLEQKMKDYKFFLKEDEDWDWHYIIKLLSYKLQRTRECILKNNVIKDSKKVASEIREVEILFNNVLADKYFDQIVKEFYQKYGRSKFVFQKKDPKTGSVQVSTIFSKETPKTRKKIHEQYFFLNQLAFEMMQSDLDKAFELMAQNIQNWWD